MNSCFCSSDFRSDSELFQPIKERVHFGRVSTGCHTPRAGRRSEMCIPFFSTPAVRPEATRANKRQLSHLCVLIYCSCISVHNSSHFYQASENLKVSEFSDSRPEIMGQMYATSSTFIAKPAVAPQFDHLAGSVGMLGNAHMWIARGCFI